jgi:Trypsin-like peptidase domain
MRDALSPNNSLDRPKSAQAAKRLGQRFHCKKPHQTARLHTCKRYQRFNLDRAFLVNNAGKEGDIAVGTGLLISTSKILTCGHVINDLAEINEARIGNKVVSLDQVLAHERVDVGIVRTKEQVDRQLPDLAFRDALLLEEVLIAGYPSVPGSLEPTLTFQRGEICGRILARIMHQAAGRHESADSAWRYDFIPLPKHKTAQGSFFYIFQSLTRFQCLLVNYPG